jgi:hypothetical protein
VVIYSPAPGALSFQGDAEEGVGYEDVKKKRSGSCDHQTFISLFVAYMEGWPSGLWHRTANPVNGDSTTVPSVQI